MNEDYKEKNAYPNLKINGRIFPIWVLKNFAKYYRDNIYYIQYNDNKDIKNHLQSLYNKLSTIDFNKGVFTQKTNLKDVNNEKQFHEIPNKDRDFFKIVIYFYDKYLYNRDIKNIIKLEFKGIAHQAFLKSVDSSSYSKNDVIKIKTLMENIFQIIKNN